MQPAIFQIDLADTTTPFPHVWEGCIGMNDPRQMLHASMQTIMARQKLELGFKRIRFHNILGDCFQTIRGTYPNHHYDFSLATKVYDAILDVGMQPFVGLCFLPAALARGKQTYHEYRGAVSPPQSISAWEALVDAFMRQLVTRYGSREVSQWFFEVWNEPNLPEWFWEGGTQQDYFDLYAAAARSIRATCPQARVGGPATAKSEWIHQMRDYCTRHNIPLDYLSTHQYPTDAAIDFTGQGLEAEQSAAPRDAMRNAAESARRHARSLPLLYNEWNISSSSVDRLMDDSYTAAFIIRTVAQVDGLVDMYGFWTATDLSNESADSPNRTKFSMGIMNIDGIPKPSYRAFQLLHGAGDNRLPVAGEHPTVDALATVGHNRVRLFLTNWERPLRPIANVTVRLDISGTSHSATATCFRIDANHANPCLPWREAANVTRSNEAIETALWKASELVMEPLNGSWRHGCLTLEVDIPPQGVVVVDVIARPGLGVE